MPVTFGKLERMNEENVYALLGLWIYLLYKQWTLRSYNNTP
jgi:hypothetical protein